MIWGLTTEERRRQAKVRDEERERRNTLKYSKWLEPYPWFAWYPVWLDDGRVVWLETVMARGWSNKYWWGDWRWSYTQPKG